MHPSVAELIKKALRDGTMETHVGRDTDFPTPYALQQFVAAILQHGCRLEVLASRETLARINAYGISKSDRYTVQPGATDGIGEVYFRFGRPLPGTD